MDGGGFEPPKQFAADFYFALEKAGFERLTLNRKRYFKGLKIHEDNGAEEDFLQ